MDINLWMRYGAGVRTWLVKVVFLCSCKLNANNSTNLENSH